MTEELLKEVVIDGERTVLLDWGHDKPRYSSPPPVETDGEEAPNPVDAERVEKGRRVKRPGSRGGKFYFTREGNVRYGNRPAYQRKVRRPAWAGRDEGFWYFKNDGPIDLETLEAIGDRGIEELGNMGVDTTQYDVGAVGYVRTRKPIPPRVAVELGLILAPWQTETPVAEEEVDDEQK